MANQWLPLVSRPHDQETTGSGDENEIRLEKAENATFEQGLNETIVALRQVSWKKNWNREMFSLKSLFLGFINFTPKGSQVW